MHNKIIINLDKCHNAWRQSIRQFNSMDFFLVADTSRFAFMPLQNGIASSLLQNWDTYFMENNGKEKKFKDRIRETRSRLNIEVGFLLKHFISQYVWFFLKYI